jgi:hypothetical protein
MPANNDLVLVDQLLAERQSTRAKAPTNPGRFRMVRGSLLASFLPTVFVSG